MSWLDDVAYMTADKDDEFGTPGIVQHMITPANARSKPDPSKPQYQVIGVYHETKKPEGMGRKNADGMHQTWLTSSRITFSVLRSSFRWLPEQGDIIKLTEIDRVFRVLDFEYETVSRLRITLEAITSIPDA